MNKLLTFSRIKQFIECRTLTMKISADGKDIPKKKVFDSRITLIGADDSISITDLKSAQSLSVRRDLKLVKVQDEDSKTRRPVYKLMTNAQYHEEELAKRKERQIKKENSIIKGQKLLTLSSRIAEHDLMTRIKKIGKLLEKQYEVKIVVSGAENDDSSFERIYSVMEKNLQSSGKIVQKRIKGSSLRFQFSPLRESSSGNEKESKSSQNSEKDGAL